MFTSIFFFVFKYKFTFGSKNAKIFAKIQKRSKIEFFFYLDLFPVL